jgi:hypothetical protein
MIFMNCSIVPVSYCYISLPSLEEESRTVTTVSTQAVRYVGSVGKGRQCLGHIAAMCKARKEGAE